jgi:chemotaxis family two-component system response regulator Rcp1
MSLDGYKRPIDILLVEDNPADARWVREALKDSRLQNTISVVADGELAMQYLRRQGLFAQVSRPDVILLDLNLPKKSGVEVLADLKIDPSLSDIPVVVLTTSPLERQSLLRIYNLPPESYILKPLNWTGFLDAIRCYRELDALFVKSRSQAI